MRLTLAWLGRLSLRCDVGAELPEAALADAAHQQEVLRAAEAAVALAVLDDARGERGPDARQPLKLFARGVVDVDGWRVFVRACRLCVRGRGRGLCGGAI